jgi:hypothetical protein
MGSKDCTRYLSIYLYAYVLYGEGMGKVFRVFLGNPKAYLGATFFQWNLKYLGLCNLDPGGYLSGVSFRYCSNFPCFGA